MKIEHFDVLLDKPPDQAYLAGQTLLGQIQVHATKRIVISGLHVTISGTMETGWRQKKGDTVFESRSNILHESLDLTTTIADHCTDDFRLHEGQHTIPFEIQLPLDVLSSVERENLGGICYTCTAVLEIPEGGGSQIIAERPLKIFCVLNLDAPHLRAPAVVSEEDEKRSLCGLRRKRVIATMRVHESGFLPGETTRITLTMENRRRKKRRLRLLKREDTRSEHGCVLISFCQQLDFVSSQRGNPTNRERRSVTIALESHGTCKAGPDNGPETKDIEFEIPSDLPPTSVQADGLITVSYFFKLDLEHFDVIVPVVIGTIKSIDGTL